MDYLQYDTKDGVNFKTTTEVLNLVINGLPSIYKVLTFTTSKKQKF